MEEIRKKRNEKCMECNSPKLKACIVLNATKSHKEGNDKVGGGMHQKERKSTKGDTLPQAKLNYALKI